MKQSEITIEQRQKMILALANTFRLTTVSEYKHMPDDLKMLFSNFDYCTIVTPLVKIDRVNNNVKIRGLAIKYHLSKGTIGRILKKPNYDYEQIFNVPIDDFSSINDMGTKQ